MVCTVVGFPLGSMTTKAKAFEAKDAIEIGADEVDMVINISALKDKDYGYLRMLLTFKRRNRKSM